MPRVSIEIPADILKELDSTADEIFASRSAALRLHWRQYKLLLSDSTSNMTDASKLDTGAHGTARECTGTTNPDPACAPASDPTIRDGDLNPSDEECPERQLAGLLRSLHWYGAKLAKDTGPDEFAARLVGAFPDEDMVPEMHKASAWLGESPANRKKQLGSFLLGWMGRIGKGPAYTPKLSTVATQQKQQNFAPRGDWK